MGGGQPDGRIAVGPGGVASEPSAGAPSAGRLRRATGGGGAGRTPAGDLAAVGAGGALGSAARYLLSLAVPGQASGPAFPWPVFAVNMSGCFLLGLVMIYLLDVWPPRRWLRLFLTTGLLGGYTTFSAYAAGIARLVQAGRIAIADAYALTSIIGGVAAVWCGAALARKLASQRAAAR